MIFSSYQTFFKSVLVVFLRHSCYFAGCIVEVNAFDANETP